jgi:hypothetical protein
MFGDGLFGLYVSVGVLRTDGTTEYHMCMVSRGTYKQMKKEQKKYLGHTSISGGV